MGLLAHAVRRSQELAQRAVPAGRLIYRGPTDARRVALTFDDGPDDLTPSYLEVLDHYGVPATFFVMGWVAGQTTTEVLTKLGPEPTRAKLVAFMDKGFEVDTRGVSSPIKFTKEDHRGPVVLRPYGYDYQTKTFKAYGKYSDYQKYVN